MSKHGLTFLSEVGIITTLILMLEPGDEVVVGDDICGGSTKIFKLGLVFRASDIPISYITIYFRGFH
jgi:O-acetylhomoserine/O-acetylserine sulfhydrylase-like pyridoxal-dependent enzyme